MPAEAISRRGNRTASIRIAVTGPGSMRKSKAPATDSLSSSACRRSAPSPARGSCTQKLLKIGNSSGSGVAVPMARPRADRPKSVSWATARK